MDYITTIEMSKIWEFHLEEFLFYVAREECLEQRKRKDLANTKRCGKANRSSKEK